MVYKVAMLKKFFLSLILILFFTEIILRITGFGYKTIHELHRKPKSGSFVIFCLGESTTKGICVAEDKNYPSQLEKLLNKNMPENNF